MIKPALLYADNVTLNSGGVSLLSSVSHIETLSDDDKVKAIAEFLPILYPDDTAAIANTKRLVTAKKRGRRTQTEIVAYEKIKRSLMASWPKITDKLFQMSSISKFQQLKCAVDSGVLIVQQFGQSTRSQSDHAISTLKSLIAASADNEMVKDSITPTLNDFVESVLKSLSSARTYPMLDSDVGRFVKARVREGFVIPAGGERRGKHAGLAFHLLEKLPCFGAASIDELLDIRKELNGPLIKFRAAICQFSESIENAIWDDDFDSDVEHVYRKGVAPAVLEIEESLKQNTFCKHFFKKETAAQACAVPIVSAALLGSIESVSDLFPVLLPSVSAAAVFATTWHAMKQEKLNIEKNKMFFFYKAGDKLTTNSRLNWGK